MGILKVTFLTSRLMQKAEDFKTFHHLGLAEMVMARIQKRAVKQQTE